MYYNVHFQFEVSKVAGGQHANISMHFRLVVYAELPAGHWCLELTTPHSVMEQSEVFFKLLLT